MTPDRSIEPPPEPLPVRWGLDTIWSGNEMKMAPDDATRLNAYLHMHYQTKGATDFTSYQSQQTNQSPVVATKINPANYDGTFVPSNSVRTVLPPNAADELQKVGEEPASGNQLVAPPWAVQKGI